MKNKQETVTDKTIKRRNFISFATFFVGAGAAMGGWKWLYHSPEEPRTSTAGAHAPLRRALNKTELFFRNLFSNNNLVRTYPVALAAKSPRVNSNIGMEDASYDINAWTLKVIKAPGDERTISLNEIRSLPKTDIVFDFKCVEGWDQIQHWGGVKMIDFITHFGLAQQTQKQYMGLETPDRKYYVGLDMASALHPQTLLAYEMNGKPLPAAHGAPLRLIIPVKYGIKNLKRVGTITFGNQRPRDYWAERGYDYYSGL